MIWLQSSLMMFCTMIFLSCVLSKTFISGSWVQTIISQFSSFSPSSYFLSCLWNTFLIQNILMWNYYLGFPSGSDDKESAWNAGDLGMIPVLGRSPGEGKGYPLQYSGLENSMDCSVQDIAKCQTWLSNFHFHWDFKKTFYKSNRRYKKKSSR